MLILFLFLTEINCLPTKEKINELPPILSVQPRHVHLAIGDKEDTFSVSWSTINKTDESIVIVYNEGEELRFTGLSTLFVDGGPKKASQWIHKVTVYGLESNRSYRYVVGSSDGWSDVLIMQTLPSGRNWSPMFAMFGDMGNDNAVSLPYLQREVGEGVYDAIIHVGDMAYDMAELDGLRGDIFMEQIEPISSMIPYMTCPGNHEWHYNFTNYKARFNMPNDDKNMFFSYDVGPIHFVSVSTEFYYFLNFGLMQVKKQYDWIQKDLASVNRSLTPWIVLYGHRPMYCTNDDRDDCTFFQTRTRTGLPMLNMWGLEDLLYKYGVDLAVWAHEHSYERLLPTYNRKVVPSPDPEQPYTDPRSTVHITTGSAGCREKHDAFMKDPPEWSAFRSTDYGFTRLFVANSTHMRIQQVSVEQDAKVIDETWLVQNNHGAFH